MRIAVLLALTAVFALGQSPVVTKPEITLDIRDFVTMPMSGKVDGKGQVLGLLARVNFMREEPAGSKTASSRIFVNDLNGPLYILEPGRPGNSPPTSISMAATEGGASFYRLAVPESGFRKRIYLLCFRSRLRA